MRPRTETLAQARVVDEVLAWGAPRPIPPEGLVEGLLARMTDAIGAWLDVRGRSVDRPGRPLLITKTRLARLVCDGLQQDPEPFVHTWANVRGTLVHAAIEEDVDGARTRDAEVVAEQAWHRLASDRPGDPSSVGAWLNARDGTERTTLLDETTTLLMGFREVWPALNGARLRIRTEQRLAVMLGGRAIRLQGIPDLLVDSTVTDGRARRLIVDLKTGMPRGQQDRDELRFYALLATLDDGIPPFRWATFYVTEGRLEHEDLSGPVLTSAADRVADAIVQAARIADGAASERLAGGSWCRGCRRRMGCPQAVTTGSDG